RANHGERAYYLAESGYRYALSVYRDESGNKVDALESLNTRPTAGNVCSDLLRLRSSAPRRWTVNTYGR
ncbi:MAG: hypothetical protein R6X33_11840, partial [Candidatus Brocadiia bacterium]